MKRKHVIIGAISTIILLGAVIVAEIPYSLQIGTEFNDAMPMINEAFRAIDGENRTKVIKNGNTPTLLMGYQKGGFGVNDYGLKIAKAGVDVTTATASQLAFTSSKSNLSSAFTFTDSVTIAASGSNVDRTYTHNLGVVPFVFCTGTSSMPVLPSTEYISATTGVGTNVSIGIVDLNTIIITYIGGRTVPITHAVTCNLLVLS